MYVEIMTTANFIPPVHFHCLTVYMKSSAKATLKLFDCRVPYLKFLQQLFNDFRTDATHVVNHELLLSHNPS